MKRIYVAGPISANDPIALFNNEKNGIDTAARLLLQGFAVFCPHLDFQYLLGVYGKDITKEALQANSMAFVECCDCMLVLPGWEKSVGTKAEMARAVTLNIPIYTNPHELVEHEREPLPELRECGHLLRQIRTVFVGILPETDAEDDGN